MEIQEDFLTQSQPLSTHMSTKGKLYIVGDSFTEPPRKEDNYQPWFSRLGTEMNLEVVNCSGMGTSQDFAVQQLSGVMHLEPVGWAGSRARCWAPSAAMDGDTTSYQRISLGIHGA